MTKVKYYYTDENGVERLARTSKNEYRFYCYGKCSKTRDNVESEKNRRIKHLTEELEWCKEKHPEWVESTQELLERAKNSKVYELYTK